MRYIDPQLVRQNLPSNWSQQAQLAETAVAGARPEDRSKEINDHDQVWKDLKDKLKNASKNKCWYCESLDIRSDNAVDHFRPKNAVAESPGHNGYWWLAFKWENYRFCCTFCNSKRIDQATGQDGGKADHFPLHDEAKRAHRPADNINDEEPMLLDPCVPADSGLLWFDETGRPCPNPSICGNTSGYTHKRVLISIKFYHLDHTDVVEQRRNLCNTIRERTRDADRYYAKYDSGDGTARGAYEDAIRDLRERIAPNAPYSSTARAMLMGLRGSHPIVDVVLSS